MNQLNRLGYDTGELAQSTVTIPGTDRPDRRVGMIPPAECSYLYDMQTDSVKRVLAALWCGLSTPLGLSEEEEEMFTAVLLYLQGPPREECCRFDPT